jgi:hypothetical protein
MLQTRISTSFPAPIKDKMKTLLRLQAEKNNKKSSSSNNSKAERGEDILIAERVKLLYSRLAGLSLSIHPSSFPPSDNSSSQVTPRQKLRSNSFVIFVCGVPSTTPPSSLSIANTTTNLTTPPTSLQSSKFRLRLAL